MNPRKQEEINTNREIQKIIEEEMAEEKLIK